MLIKSLLKKFLLTIDDVMKCENVNLTLKLTPQDEKKHNNVNCDVNVKVKNKKPTSLHDLLHGVDLTMWK